VRRVSAEQTPARWLGWPRFRARDYGGMAVADRSTTRVLGEDGEVVVIKTVGRIRRQNGLPAPARFHAVAPWCAHDEEQNPRRVVAMEEKALTRPTQRQ
jgi:hypothetical protein